MVLIGLLGESFMVNLTSKLPNHIIYVRKEDVKNIEDIFFTYNLKSVNLTGLSTIDLTKLVSLSEFWLNQK